VKRLGQDLISSPLAPSYNCSVNLRDAAEGPSDKARIHLFGDFKFVRADGVIVPLRNRKCEALVALLVANDPFGVMRDFAAEILWPDRSQDQRRENLRQVLAIIRRELGSEFLSASRVSCRIADAYDYESDLKSPELRTSAMFMPGQEGDWFDGMRLESEPATPSEQPEPILIQQLAMLRWCARNDPRTMFALWRASPAITGGISRLEILSLLQVASVAGEPSGWGNFWRGYAEDDLVLCGNYLRRALKSAIRDEEWSLASSACFELGKVYSRLGFVDRANRIADAAEQVATKAKTRSAQGFAQRLRGTLLLHWGEPRKGLAKLKEASELIDDPVGVAIIDSSRAWYQITAGYVQEASRTLEYPEAVGRELGHDQIETLCSMTRAMLTVHEGSRHQALPALELVARRCYAAGISQFAVYAEETLAKLHLLDHEREMASLRLNAARQGRLRTKMITTPLESARIAAIR